MGITFQTCEILDGTWKSTMRTPNKGLTRIHNDHMRKYNRSVTTGIKISTIRDRVKTENSDFMEKRDNSKDTDKIYSTIEKRSFNTSNRMSHNLVHNVESNVP